MSQRTTELRQQEKILGIASKVLFGLLVFLVVLKMDDKLWAAIAIVLLIACNTSAVMWATMSANRIIRQKCVKSMDEKCA